MANFADYSIESDLVVYDLAEGLLREISAVADLETPASFESTEAHLEELVFRVGPERELQKNIEQIRYLLGENATGLIADWIERSGIMAPISRGFMENEPLPRKVDALVWSGGVANWMLRRMVVTQGIRPDKYGKLYLSLSTRKMKPQEHELVAQYEAEHHRPPTEYDFAKEIIRPRLIRAGMDPKKVEVINTGESEGDEVLKTFLHSNRDLMDGSVIVVANAPNAIQAAGQLRVAARSLDATFDSSGNQLFVVSDSFPLARAGQKPATHQNPDTALGQLARNALFLHRNIPEAVTQHQPPDEAS